MDSTIVDLQAFSREELEARTSRMWATFWTALGGTALYLIAWVLFFRREREALGILRGLYLGVATLVWGGVLYLSWTLDLMLRVLDRTVPMGPYVAALILTPVLTI